ncbi:hypothetical protein F5Y14DRAFT_254568 [Nemania sp. NC0429]|nr:hypothetical protein F5Y14DRAFT_254568 [Nemania sp. NC0429]
MAPLLPTLAARARSLIASAVTARSQAAAQTASNNLSRLGPLAARAALLARDDDDNKDQGGSGQPDPTIGVTDPSSINNTFIFILFGLIGVAFVITGIWFFFWAKNGGFHFKDDDWEEYKSTVLRRRGPNGTLLSGATPSTDLGGGSVYKDVYDDGATEYTGGLTQMTGETADTSDTVSTLTGITAGASDIAGRERRRRAREKKEREHEKKRDRRHRRKVGEDGALVDEEAEADAKRNLRAYRGERAARVGGLNKEAEGSEWDGSTNPEMSTVSGGSELLLANRQGTPTSTPTKDNNNNKRRSTTAAAAAPSELSEVNYATESQAQESPSKTNNNNNNNNATTTTAPPTSSRKAGGIRKVYSTADRTTNRENERLRAEARQLRMAERSRAAAAGPPSSLSSSSSSTSASSLSSAAAHQNQHPSASGASRRDYSYQRADLRNPASAIAEEPGSGPGTPLIGTGRYLPAPEPVRSSVSWAPESDIGDGSDLGTKSYRHYIPGISPSSGAGAGASAVDDGSVAAERPDDRRERRRWRDAQRSRRE